MNAPATSHRPSAPITLSRLTPDQVRAIREYVCPLSSAVVVASASSAVFALSPPQAQAVVAEALAGKDLPSRGYPRQPLQGVSRKLEPYLRAGAS